ncbi:MAG: acyl carrier protein [Desulfobaccales bacterium]
MKDNLFRIISNVMNVPIEFLNEESSPDNVESWDSLKHLNLILAIEQEFNIVLTDEEIIEMMNVQLILAILKDKLGSC